MTNICSTRQLKEIILNKNVAVYNPYTSCGNSGLDIAADIAGTQHYGGPGRQATDGTFYLVDGSGNRINQQGYLWNQGYLWKNGFLSNQSFVPSVASFIAVNHWVGQE